MGIFDDILAKTSAEDKAVFDRHPELKSSVEKLEKDLDTSARYNAQFLDWRKKNWLEDQGMTVREKTLADELAAANARIQAAADAGADPDSIQAALKTEREALDTKFKELQNQFGQSLEGMHKFYGSIAPKLLTHQKEFGEVLDPNSVLKYMEDNKINDVNTAYDKMVAPRRDEASVAAARLLDEQHQEALKKAKEEGVAEGRLQSTMGPQGDLPTDQTGGILGVTVPISKPMEIPKELAESLSGHPLGDGTRAAVGLDMYRRGQLQTS